MTHAAAWWLLQPSPVLEAAYQLDDDLLSGFEGMQNLQSAIDALQSEPARRSVCQAN
jgi:hypothetical protein